MGNNMGESKMVRAAAAAALLMGLLAVPLAGTGGAAPAQTCSGYTAMIVFVNPTVGQPGDPITIEGVGTAGETVQATLQSSPPQSLGSAVAGFFGEFEINTNLPDPLADGTYAITVTSNACPAFELSVVVENPPAPMMAFSTSSDDDEPLSVDDGTSTPEADSDDESGESTDGGGSEDGGSTESVSTGDDAAEGDDTTVAGAQLDAPVSSSCGVSEPGRTFLPGQQVNWTLQDATFDTSRDVRLRLRSSSTIVTLAPIGPWPASNQIEFTVPANLPAGQYTVEQAGYQLSDGKIKLHNCAVYLTDAPSPAMAAGFSGQNTTLLGGLVISALAAAALLQLRIRRLRRI